MVDDIESDQLVRDLSELTNRVGDCENQFQTFAYLLDRDLYRGTFILGTDLMVRIGRIYARIAGRTPALHSLPDLLDHHADLLPAPTLATAQAFCTHIDEDHAPDRQRMIFLSDALHQAVNLCRDNVKDHVERQTPGWILVRRRIARVRRLSLATLATILAVGWSGWQIYQKGAEQTAYVLNPDNSVTRAGGKVYRPAHNGMRGWVEGAKQSETSLLVSGWVLDPAAPATTRVLAFINGKSVYSAPVTQKRVDVNAVFGIDVPSGFEFVMNIAALPQPVRLTFAAVSSAGNALLLNCNPAACDVK